MAIKNWTVRTKAVTGGSGGVAAYGRYLEDTNHRNHRGKTEAITPVSGDWRRLTAEQALRASQRTAEAQARGRGGRPVETLAQSFVVSLPAELRPTRKQWLAIARDVVKAIQSKLPVDQAIAGAGDVFVNAHENVRNPHLNIVIGKLAENGEIRKRVTQKAVLSAVKNAVNAAVVRELGVDHSEYVPRRSGLRNMEKWQYEQELAKEAIQRAHEAELHAHEAELHAQGNVQELAEAAVSLRERVSLMLDVAQMMGDLPSIQAALAADQRMPAPSDLEREIMAENAYERSRDAPDYPAPSPRYDDTGPSGP